jgi:hypothetical protein
MILVNLLFIGFAVDLGNQFEEQRLQIVVNYATEAAVQEMTANSASLDQDYESISKISVDPYESISKISVDPAVALDTFAVILGKNYNIPLSSINKQSILLDYVPVFMVATYDGYYTTSDVVINSSGVENKIFSPKMPYLYQVTEIDGTTTDYSLNMSLETAIKVDAYGNITKEVGVIPEELQSSFINEQISDALNAKLVEVASTRARGTFYIPSEATTVGATNAIKSTTVFAYIDNFDLHGKSQDLQSFGVGGSRIKNNDFVAGFLLNDAYGLQQKYYCYSKDLPATAVLVEVFDTPEEAAQSGYYYYIE